MRFDLKAVFRTAAIFLILAITCLGIDAQMLSDTASVRLIKKCITSVYNYRFDEARQTADEISHLHPGHPALLLINSVMTYWENFPLLPSSPARDSFERELRDCMEICGNNEESENEAEYLLINLCARGMLLLYMTDNGIYLDIVPLALGTYQHIKHSFEYISTFYDFNYFKGVFDYYREAYPEKYPVYKPLATLFPKGDKEKGLRELNLCADSSIFLRAEALMVLEDLSLRYEDNKPLATHYNMTLYESYPGNPEFMEDYIKDLLYIKQYDNAEKLLGMIAQRRNNPFFKAQLLILEGIFQEKKYHNNERAKSLYTKGIEEIGPFGRYADEYSSYAYYGLSRISEQEGDKHLKKAYRREANRLSEFKKMNFDD